jgi:hypothetical protein
MFKKGIVFLIVFLLYLSGYSQVMDSVTEEPIDTVAFQKAEGKKPIQNPWTCTMLVDAQTSLLPTKGSFEIIIQHRFTNLDNGIKDLFGLYGASNICLSLNYAILDRLMIGFSTEKDKKFQELYLKAKLLEQNKSGKMPLSLTFFGNAAINARNKSFYGSNYKFMDKLSYFGELILARKFCNIFSLEAAVSYSHFNAVDGIKTIDTIIDASNPSGSIIRTAYHSLYQNDVLGVTAGARINFYRGMSFLLEYDQGFNLMKTESQQLKPKPNVALALEIGTSTHCFQIFASSYRGIIPQQNFVMNQFDFTKLKGLMLGFNITVRLN